VHDTSGGADGAALLGQMIAISRAHALRMPPSLVGLARALAILDGVVRTLDPAADPIADVRREMAWAAMREVWRRVVMVVAWIVATARRAVRRGAALVAMRGAPRSGAPVGRESIAD
jgi:predicted unusual protein kinase regulating ubiquinone biosynthesis (AarF/ABC1/UbiB family)